MKQLTTLMRTLIDDTVNGTVRTTYVGEGYMSPAESLTDSKAAAIWKITKYVETTAGDQKVTEMFYPIDDMTLYASDTYTFVWDDRASYSYQ